VNSHKYTWNSQKGCWEVTGDDLSYGVYSRPTYYWQLSRDTMVYENASMMQAIDSAVDGMTEFPDAERLLKPYINNTQGE
jgi:hypothetical protein